MNHAGENTITFVITSCGRFDLLNDCLASFFKHNTAPMSRYILIEDSSNHGVREIAARYDVPIEVIVNDPPLGQIASIDRAYQTVTTPYIFHCEDDWLFFRSGFVEDSLILLKHKPSITAVICRRPGQNPHTDLIFKKGRLESVANVFYRKPDPWLSPTWLGYSFNPGLRRLSDYRSLGSFARLGTEREASVYFKLLGRTIAVLAKPACETTGLDRHLPKREKLRFILSR
jgi:Glycosyl transferase family 2